ncbi:hypothetical protein BCR33DRAFT_857715 [Rhizoclosmatium globosum]|uniref:Uncharacterized protein n=1 Tax=Rhizoclosmatium globosum TaxID=329046 RepID=A0A1Y2B3Q3_9FUNG|nr:hypothetical protein BCR33DRAFT_857715 [Rhizoclosmatium globosum]|eukprot:ORY29453.1 hypothetical protein BCR33DRAFT_857715 [Rhizoclosmatium globosum]
MNTLRPYATPIVLIASTAILWFTANRISKDMSLQLNQLHQKAQDQTILIQQLLNELQTTQAQLSESNESIKDLRTLFALDEVREDGESKLEEAVSTLKNEVKDQSNRLEQLIAASHNQLRETQSPTTHSLTSPHSPAPLRRQISQNSVHSRSPSVHSSNEPIGLRRFF